MHIFDALDASALLGSQVAAHPVINCLRGYNASVEDGHGMGTCADTSVLDGTSYVTLATFTLYHHLEYRAVIFLNLNYVRSIWKVPQLTNTISDWKEYHLRPEEMPYQTERNAISDRKEYHLRLEGIPSQDRRNTSSDQKEYQLRPEGIPSLTGSNTISDGKEYHIRPEGITFCMVIEMQTVDKITAI